MPAIIANKIKLPDNTIVEINDNRIVVNNAQSGQVLSYVSTNDRWTNQTINVDLAQNITYSTLVALKTNSNLEPGKLYRITDYTTTTVQDNTQSAGHVFDLVVMATSDNTLDCCAKAVLHSGDTYFSTAGADLAKWQVWYDTDNDTTKYAWADETNGTGVIYRLIDEFKNDCPYDFKNVLFTVDGKTENAYTFNLYTNDTCSDYSLNGAYCYGNVMKPHYTLGMQVLNFNVFYNTFVNAVYRSSSSPNPVCYSNIFGFACRNNNFGNYCHLNTFGDECDSNTFGNYCHLNTFGDECDSNTFGEYCHINTFGDECDSNTFGEYCHHNTFGNYCFSNTFGDDCSFNTFGSIGCYNTFSVSCYSNTFMTECVYNTFGNECTYNTFGNACGSNIFGNKCHYNTLGNNCNYIVFGDASTPSAGGSYCSHNIIDNGNMYIRLYQTTDENSSKYLQNIYVAQGVNNTTTWYDISSIARNLSYRTTVAMNKAGSDRIIYCEDEITDMLPSIANNAGKILAVNSGATGVEWITNSGGGGSSLPSQTGHSGEYLTTNGTDASWQAVCLINLYD